MITTSGRISGVTEPVNCRCIFRLRTDLVAIDDALKYGSRASEARFAVYIGDLGSDTAARAREILARCPRPITPCCLPSRPTRASSRSSMALRSGDAAPRRPRRRSGGGAAAFEQGHLVDGLVSAIKVLSEHITPA